MKQDWTSGPWMAAAKPSSVVGWPVVSREGRSICSVSYVQHSPIDPPVAGDTAFNAEARANARLIAAAPDMVEALEALVEISYHGIYAPSLFDKARAALTKARGQSVQKHEQ